MPKSAGEGIMISDFISTLPGNEKVQLLSAEHRSRAIQLLKRPLERDSAMLMLNYNRDGYYTAEKFQRDLEEVCAIISSDPNMVGHHALVLLDSSTVHRARGTNLDSWTVGSSEKVKNFPAGVELLTEDGPTKIQLANNEGVFKGLKFLAEALGFDKTLHAKNVRRAVKGDYIDFILQQPSFLNAERKAADVIAEKCGNISILWLPRYHCELNPIERVWAFMKHICRSRSDWTRTTLLRNIKDAKNELPTKTILLYYRRVYNICVLYRQGKSLSEIYKLLYNRNRTLTRHTVVAEDE